MVWLVWLLASLAMAQANKTMGSDEMAECVLQGALQGTIVLHWTDASRKATMFMGKISGLSEGKHGFHVHQVRGAGEAGGDLPGYDLTVCDMTSHGMT